MCSLTFSRHLHSRQLLRRYVIVSMTNCTELLKFGHRPNLGLLKNNFIQLKLKEDNSWLPLQKRTGFFPQ